MEELPLHMGGGCYLQKKVEGGDLGEHIPNSDLKGGRRLTRVGDLS